MAKRKRRRVSHSKKTEYPPFIWMLFGLAIGLSVAFAVYVKSNEPATVAKIDAPQPASLQSALDDNDEAPAPTATEEKPENKRFTFYDILPNFEVITPETAPEVEADVAPKRSKSRGFTCFRQALSPRTKTRTAAGQSSRCMASNLTSSA